MESRLYSKIIIKRAARDGQFGDRLGRELCAGPRMMIIKLGRTGSDSPSRTELPVHLFD